MAGRRHPRAGDPARQTLPLVFALLLLLYNPGIAQTGWESLAGGRFFEHNPLCVAVIDSLHAVVGGWAGYIARTTDGGTTWIRSQGGSTDNFEGISFPDRYHGTLVGGTQTAILRTDDGGMTWRRQTNGPFLPDETFNSVSFSDSLNGVIGTLQGRIYHTSDGGESWVSTGPAFYRGLRQVRLKSSYGLAVGYVGDTFRTTDGGQSWFFHSGATGGRALRDVFLRDSLNALAVGDEGVIRRTTDGGLSWMNVASGTTAHFQSVSFHDDLNGLIGSVDGSVLRTTDGGVSWSAPAPTPMQYVWDMEFDPAGFGICVTRFDGRIFRTGDGGNSWEELEYTWGGPYHGVWTVSPGSVYAVGDGGRIAFSSDSGRSWELQEGTTAANLRDVNFRNPFEGWIVGDSGVILRTTDAGTGWIRKSPPGSDNFLAVSSPGEDVGIVVGENNSILRTSDGGATWATHPAPLFDHWQAVSFLDADEGVAAGRAGTIIKTTDGGLSWFVLHSVAGLTDIEYIDRDHIYAVGTLSDDSLRGLLRTTDGGSTWSFHRENGWNVTDGSFANPGFGCLAGGQAGLFVTEDSGRTWTDLSPSAAPFQAVSMAGPRGAFAAGDSGVIARMRVDGSVRGECFHDLNHDGIRTVGEGGLGGRRMYLDGPFIDSSTTGPDGSYIFSFLPYGSYTVRPQTVRFWEQTTPPLFTADTVRVSSQSDQAVYRNIGFGGPIARLRIPIYVSDNTTFAHRFLWLGVRPGATFGIWGADSTSSETDSVEAEFEIPPRSFPLSVGLFDARFTDPHFLVNEYSRQFGEGAWTDVRGYSSPAQRDTFLLSFLPGYYYGGNYPMTLRWQADLVSQSFGGPAILIDRYGSTIDMKSTGSVTITDRTVGSMFLVTGSPLFPNAWLARWRLLSLPAPVADGSVRSLFPSADTKAYSFVQGAGFQAHDTLRPNLGYWLKYPSAIDTLVFDSTARLRDTVTLTRGWNLIGALSAPVDVSSVTTVPADLALGSFWGFEGGYTVPDGLLPGKAYWVHSDGEGLIVLDAGAPGFAGGSRKERHDDGAAVRFSSLRVQDADSNAAVLRLFGDDGVDLSEYQLPPLPPPGAFDVRYASGRSAEVVREGAVTEYPIRMSSARFPLTLTLSQDAPVPAFLSIAGELIPLSPGLPVVLHDAGALQETDDDRGYVLTLTLPGRSGTPKDYALMQNYPNPFNPATLIPYSLPVASHVRIGIYDVVGREIAVLRDRVEEAGYQSVPWDARDVATGIYFYRMEAVSLAGPMRTFTTVKKLVLLR